MTIEEFTDEIKKYGYKQYGINHNSTITYQAHRDFLPLCYSNEKSFINIEVYTYRDRNPSVSVKICAKTSLNQWVELSFYSMQMFYVATNLIDLESRLIAAWQAI